MLANATAMSGDSLIKLILTLASCVSLPGGGALLPSVCAAAAAPGLSLQPVLDFASVQLNKEIKDFPAGSEQFPGRNTTADGSWARVAETDWVSGFMNGCLWKMHALTGNSIWSKAATAQLPSLESMKTYTGTHDIGFIIGSSFGNALQAVPPPSKATAEKYRKVMQTAAASLAQRYNPKMKLIRSWGKDLTDPEFKVIIDNLMNLDLLFKAAALPNGKPEWRDIAVAHATRTARDFVRGDGSTVHKIIYDANTGKVISNGTHQGYADSSTWSRGQGWALHGFTLAYEATGSSLFRKTAQRTADLFLKRLSKDWVPLWDFDAPAFQPWKDTSAGAVAAGGLLRLAKVSSSSTSVRYRTAALRILEALATKYLSSSAPRGSPRLASILRNGTVTAPQGMHSTGTIFGDYYMLDALALAYGRQSAAPAA